MEFSASQLVSPISHGGVPSAAAWRTTPGDHAAHLPTPGSGNGVAALERSPELRLGSLRLQASTPGGLMFQSSTPGGASTNYGSPMMANPFGLSPDDLHSGASEDWYSQPTGLSSRRASIANIDARLDAIRLEVQSARRLPATYPRAAADAAMSHPSSTQTRSLSLPRRMLSRSVERDFNPPSEDAMHTEMAEWRTDSDTHTAAHT